ncbi:MAG: DUF2330 domain-containing protein [Deltaproteobacteria bacterium]|nr:DUF2330 domain-containing protein [Deltaproteobacteria bacterium]
MRLAPSLVVAALALFPTNADAFCGFYVAGGDQKMFNDATQVVLMRSGTRTVLSMQNDYKGPPTDFAMVIPVPVVLREGDVKTLTKEVFARVEAMGAPRLVEYWEQDPCPIPQQSMGSAAAGAPLIVEPVPDLKPTDTAADLGVTIEAKFTVGEYQVVILSAKESTGLDTWLRQEGYQIPAGAEPLLRPYVESGMKFFVAKVDPDKVTFVDGRASLSPLRFHYDTEEFSLPIRLGLANSSGTQDLIVNILAPQQRYEVANYDNVTIPTNLDVDVKVKDKFGAFYAALFDRTIEMNPGAVVTEYAWQATTCDPCPGPALDQSHFLTLGADVLGGSKDRVTPYAKADFVLTRLHARYGTSMKDDLRFTTAAPIAGGREVRTMGRLEERATSSKHNNFQGRYAIRYPWTGPIRCEKPVRGVWGEPPAELHQRPGFVAPEVKPALDLAFASRGSVQLASAVLHDVPEIDVRVGASRPTEPPLPAAPTGDRPQKKRGCGCQATDRDGPLVWAVLVGVLFLRRRRG